MIINNLKQACSEGKLTIEQCPPNFMWNSTTSACDIMSDHCSPRKSWSLQFGLDLDECIGRIKDQCSIGFYNLNRAQKYCEITDGCAGVKQDKCKPSIGIDIECIGSPWRPYRTIIDGKSTDQIYVVQKIGIGNSNDENESKEFKLKFDWGEPQSRIYSGCADGYVKMDFSCKTVFDSVNAAMSYCELLEDSCDGVAIQDDKYTAISDIEPASALFLSRSEKFGSVFTKLNRLFERLLDERTKNTMLVEFWESPISGSLDMCSTDTDSIENCTPQFDNLFEAQFHCESLGDNCAGVTEEDGAFTTRKNTEIISKPLAKSWLKAAWCSDHTPPLAIKLPTIFNVGNVIEIIWPVVNFDDVVKMMKSSPNKNLHVVGHKYQWKYEDFNRYAIDMRINADTIIFDKKTNLMNIKNLVIKSRKVLIQNQATLTFDQSSAISSDWFNSTAPPPGSSSASFNGNHGQHGVQGFHATEVRIEAGCIHGAKDQLRINLKSGNGQKGQHGSAGKNGTDGERIPDSAKLVPRYNSCSNFCSCSGSLCWHRDHGDRHEYGEDCTPEKEVYQGTNGGDGGNGGNGGKPGNPGTDLNFVNIILRSIFQKISFSPIFKANLNYSLEKVFTSLFHSRLVRSVSMDRALMGVRLVLQPKVVVESMLTLVT